MTTFAPNLSPRVGHVSYSVASLATDTYVEPLLKIIGLQHTSFPCSISRTTRPLTTLYTFFPFVASYLATRIIACFCLLFAKPPCPRALATISIRHTHVTMAHLVSPVCAITLASLFETIVPYYPYRYIVLTITTPSFLVCADTPLHNSTYIRHNSCFLFAPYPSHFLSEQSLHNIHTVTLF